MLVALSDYKWVLTVINTHSILSFVYLMCKYSVYYEKSRIEDIVLILMVDHHFFRPRNTL